MTDATDPADKSGVTDRRRPSGATRAVIVAVVAFTTALVVSLVVVSNNDDGGDAGVEVVLEPIGSSRPSDFFGNLDVAAPGSSIAIALGRIPPLGSGVSSALAGLTAAGDEPGLYGGSRNNQVCDVDQLTEFLTDPANAEKARAWAGVHGIEVADIPDFLDGLTAVRLRRDTAVTNHGFDNGAATPFQSILEAGTAVLVDEHGVPRVKCNCGNPLTEPAPLGDLSEQDAHDVTALAENPDDAWDGLDPRDVVTITGTSDPVAEMVLIDTDTGETFTRPTGTNGDADSDVDPDQLDAICDTLADSPSCGGPPVTADTTSTTIEGGAGIDPCLIGQWTSGNHPQADFLQDASLEVSGGDGVAFEFREDGTASVNFDTSTPIIYEPDISAVTATMTHRGRLEWRYEVSDSQITFSDPIADTVEYETSTEGSVIGKRNAGDSRTVLGIQGLDAFGFTGTYECSDSSLILEETQPDETGFVFEWRLERP